MKTKFKVGEMFEEARTYKLIFRDNATILLKDGKRYVSKCIDGDTYDREKGLLMCLAKANGVSYRDLQEMIASADMQVYKKKKVKEVKRLAKVGEYVKVINAGSSLDNEYKNGDILKIVKVGKNIFGHCAYYKDESLKYLNKQEYVVLENYKPYKITLSEFWESQDKLAIKYENDKQGESIYNKMIDRGFYCKVRCKGISDGFEEGYSYIFNDKCIFCAINQGGLPFGRKVYNFDEVDLDN